MTTTTTAAELLYIEDLDCRHEVVGGELRTRPFLTFAEGCVAGALQYHARDRLEGDPRGHVVAAGGFVLQQGPDTVLAPTLAVLPPDAVIERAGAYPTVTPLLVVDVTSHPEDRPRLWLDAGVPLVVMVDAHAPSAVVHRPDEVAQVLGEGDALDGGDVLPGFRLPLADVFDD